MVEESPSLPVIGRIRHLLGLGGEDGGGGLPELSFDALLRSTRRSLLEYARLLGLSVSQGADDALAPSDREPPLLEEPPDRAHKFDLGRAAEAPGVVEHIPWSYGQDRVTAMVVDGDRLYVYWEVTDEAIARARERLGVGGPAAWLDLRVYDVTGRIFDGTNAHGYFDHRIERSDRQWFFHVGRPSSTVVVELGLKSPEGYFVRMARSGRAEFPRREPVPPGAVEWLTVRTASGEVGEPVALGGVCGPEAPVPGDAAAPRAILPHVEAVRVWDIRRMHGAAQWLVRNESFGERVFEWRDGGMVTWEAGPFSFPVDPPPYVEERDGGSVTVRTEHGRTHVVYGPWRVVIRGLGARAERRVLAVWEVYRSWIAGAGGRACGATERAVGGSEERLGASERRWLAGSEVRLGGASERYRVGASELRWQGASETLSGGASEWRYAGASEWRLAGASELHYAGGSEWRLAGASERGHAGASERPAGVGETSLGYPRPAGESSAASAPGPEPRG